MSKIGIMPLLGDCNHLEQSKLVVHTEHGQCCSKMFKNSQGSHVLEILFQ